MTDPHKTAIENLGWTPIEASERTDNTVVRSYQARCGSFRTPWLSSWADVLQAIRGKQNAYENITRQK